MAGRWLWITQTIWGTPGTKLTWLLMGEPRYTIRLFSSIDGMSGGGPMRTPSIMPPPAPAARATGPAIRPERAPSGGKPVRGDQPRKLGSNSAVRAAMAPMARARSSAIG